MQGIVRSDVLSQYDLKPGVKTVLIFGGSQGALKINQAVVNALPILAKKIIKCYMLQVKDITIKLKKKSGCPRMYICEYLHSTLYSQYGRSDGQL